MLDHPIKPLHKQDIQHLEFRLNEWLKSLFGWERPEHDKAQQAGVIKGMTMMLDELGYEVKIEVKIVRDKYHREEVDKKK